MTNTPARRRAPGMSPEQRREAVVRAALPLVAEHGASVTTAQVARMAGIGEATIFRVFADKEELLDAVVAAALDPATVLGELRSIPLDQPLADRLVEAADALEAHLGRMGTVLGALHASGHGRSRRRGEAPRERSAGRDASQAETRDAVAALLEPEREALRLPVEQLTEVFLAFVGGRGRFPGGGAQELSNRELVELFLHGALGAAGDAK
ncbi:TetR/AcrR family transcriptional regulator [Micromonospora avicenniae]|uniref:TetR/AcrR family transcriptional regulator n=1 Tax=Micromonospora avicenniae TaxID=1198245 RepID=UPI00331920BC